jgi:membrane protease YdiL (CAAX protease family)
MLFFNITGEELWWRGYILLRQELSQGCWAWLIHGVLWTLFHAFKWWDLLNLLPVCLLISYAAQRTKNNWIPCIAHYLFNGLGFLVVLLAVLGLI